MKKIIILILILLTGCSPKNKQIDIVFVENAEFAKDSDVNSCTLIKSVNGEEKCQLKSPWTYLLTSTGTDYLVLRWIHQKLVATKYCSIIKSRSLKRSTQL